jgi:type VI secretion system protein ImpA
MSLHKSLLDPIAGANPSGQNLRLLPIYDQIREARREDDSLAQGAWQRERKIANHVLAAKLIQQALTTQSKDLQLAVWLCDSLLKSQGIRGLQNGLAVCQALLERFWGTLFPQIDDGDLDGRAAPLEWAASKLLVPVKSVPLCHGGYNFLEYTDSRTVEYEEFAKSKDQKAARERALKDGKLAPELFDKSFAETPKAFYQDLDAQFDSAIKAVQGLDETCAACFGRESAPSFTRLQETLQEVRRLVHQFLQKKREIEPDPVEPAPVPAPAPAPGHRCNPAAGPMMPSTQPPELAIPVLDETAGRREAVSAIAAAAAILRRENPLSSAPYLLLRGLRWGELRESKDPADLESPPAEFRRQIKRLALDNQWRELLELAESAMAHPFSRAWLDLQRFAVEACLALGEDYNDIADAIRSELRALLRDLPQLIEATLDDDTPAANGETQAWLKELLNEPSAASSAGDAHSGSIPGNSHGRIWRRRHVDPHARALAAMQAGQPVAAIRIMQREIDQETSGRGRFRRKLQLAQLCLFAGKDAIAQPLLDDIAAEIDAHKLDDWEEKELIAGALAFLLQSSKRVQNDVKIKQAMFERVCRLDPAQAMPV